MGIVVQFSGGLVPLCKIVELEREYFDDIEDKLINLDEGSE